jgi:tungstate transport system ATP-binding protein
MIAAEAVRYGYSDAVVEDVTLSADPGEVLAVIGPSGTGKTTLLRLLALFDRPDAGRITAEGRDVWTLSADERLAIRQRVGFVFQDRSLFSTSVAHNAAYGLAVRRSWRERLRRWIGGLVGEDPVPEAVREALDTVGLAGKTARPARSLSAGEAQRVAFARALAVDPDVLLLDEPTSNLDPRNTAVIEEAVLEARDRDIAVVVATHDMQQARRIADRVAVLLDGTVIERGAADRVFERPEDERARGFIDGELVY